MIFPVAEMNDEELKRQQDILYNNFVDVLAKVKARSLLADDLPPVIITWKELASRTVFENIDNGNYGVIVRTKGEKECGLYTFYEDC